MSQITLTETTSFANAITLLEVADSTAVSELFLESQIGDVVSDVRFTGSDEAAFLVHEFAVAGVFSFTGGLMLSTGDFPGSTNTVGSYSISHDTPGDFDLTETAQTAFPEAGESQDAVVLEFKVNVVGDTVRGISFDIVFGSEEYPEFSDTDFVDVAAIYVNGVNVALFNDDPSTPLSVTQRNVDTGNFVDNDFDFDTGASPYAIEWDGFSNVLTVRAALNEGANTVKIGIADTGDWIYDSGLYLNNIELLSEGGVGGGVLTVRNGDDGDNSIDATTKKEEINLFGGKDNVKGTPLALNGDVITGFGPDDVLTFLGVGFGLPQLTVAMGSAILAVDTDLNGQVDTTLTLTGEFSGASFQLEQENGNTELTLLQNTVPTASDAAISANEDQQFTGSLPAASDVDGDPITYALATPANHGAASVNADGSFTYLAAQNFYGNDSFQYSVSDGTGSSTYSVTVTVAGALDLITGTANADTIVDDTDGPARISGLAGDDTMAGGTFDDELIGGGGFDTAVFGGNLVDYSLNKGPSGYTVADRVSGDGTDTVSEVEHLRFADMTVNLSVQASAAAAPPADVTRMIELYVAFFNRVPDADGLAYWIGERVSGQSVNQIAESFYTAGAQYTSLTGFSAGMSDADFVDVVYRNVLGRQDGADQGGLDYWTTQLALHRQTSGAQGETRGSLVSTILDSAHTFKGNPYGEGPGQFGQVADLLDNKIAVGRTFAIDWGLNYNTPQDSIANGMAIAAAITPVSIDAAIALVGVDPANLVLG